MSWLTASEIVVWLALAAGVGAVLGATLATLWHRARVRRTPPQTPQPVVAVAAAEQRLIKGNATSHIFHVPGSPAYARTRADVWFATEDEAVAAGYRKPKNG